MDLSVIAANAKFLLLQGLIGIGPFIGGIVYAGLAATAPEGRSALLEKARADFSSAAALNPLLAAYNRARLDGTETRLGFAASAAGGEIVQFRPELLAGLAPQVQSDAATAQLVGAEIQLEAREPGNGVHRRLPVQDTKR